MEADTDRFRKQSNQEKELTLLRTTIYKYEGELQKLHTELTRARAEVQAEEARRNAVSANIYRLAYLCLSEIYLTSQYKADAAKYMEAESKASAQCYELETQILEMKSRLKEIKSQAKTAETKVVATSSDPQLKRERDQLFVSPAQAMI